MNPKHWEMARMLTKIRPALATATWFEDREMLGHANASQRMVVDGKEVDVLESAESHCYIGDTDELHFVIAAFRFKSGNKAAEGFVRLHHPGKDDPGIMPLPPELAEECLQAAEAFFAKGGKS